jgi:hypothetical protein
MNLDEIVAKASEEIDAVGESNVMIANYFGEKQSIVNDPKWVQSDGWNYLKYHKSWEWLMPVIEKLAKTKGIHFASWCDGTLWVYRFEEQGGGILSQGIKEEPINAAYKAVCEMVAILVKQKEAKENDD